MAGYKNETQRPCYYTYYSLHTWLKFNVRHYSQCNILFDMKVGNCLNLAKRFRLDLDQSKSEINGWQYGMEMDLYTLIFWMVVL
jgi:hypothetical protein